MIVDGVKTSDLLNHQFLSFKNTEGGGTDGPTHLQAQPFEFYRNVYPNLATVRPSASAYIRPMEKEITRQNFSFCNVWLSEFLFSCFHLHLLFQGHELSIKSL